MALGSSEAYLAAVGAVEAAERRLTALLSRRGNHSRRRDVRALLKARTEAWRRLARLEAQLEIAGVYHGIKRPGPVDSKNVEAQTVCAVEAGSLRFDVGRD